MSPVNFTNSDNYDPLRPPDTDEEPWSVPDDRARSRDWAVACFLLLALLAVVAWKVTR